MNMEAAITDALNVNGMVPSTDVEGEGEAEIIEPAEPMEIIKVKSEVPVIPGTDLIHDYSTARNILHSLTTVNAEAIGEAMQLVREVQHPRSFDVLNALISNMRGISTDLMKLQKEYAKTLLDIEGNGEGEDDDSNDGKTVNTQNNYFSGTTEEMLKQMEKTAKKELKSDE